MGVITYVVKNHGSVPAIINEARAGFIMKRKEQIIPLPDTVFSDNPLFIDNIISANEDRGPIKDTTPRCVVAGEEDIPGDIIGVSVDGDDRDYTDVTPIFRNDKFSLYFRVVISYRGPFTDRHETSACWRYDKMLQQFEKTAPQKTTRNSAAIRARGLT